MKAIHSTAPGGPETLVLATGLPLPEPGPGQVRISVRAASLNFPDLLIIEDRYQFKPERPFAPGGEVAGVVSAIGQGVTTLAPSDRVVGATLWGALAEEVVADAGAVTRIPDAMPFDTASALLIAYATAWHGIMERGELKPGETLLVLGASGGVGLAAVELGRAMGARVIAACSTPGKLEAARAAGAHDGLVYPKGTFGKDGIKTLSQQFKSACGPMGADVVFDPVGGEMSEAAVRAIAWKGRLLVVGFVAGIPALPLNLTLLKGCDVRGVFWGEAMRRDPAGHAVTMQQLFDLHAQGRIAPRIQARFPLKDTAQAMQLLGSRNVVGKVVVTLA